MLIHSPLKVSLKITYAANYPWPTKNICADKIKSKMVQGLRLKHLTFHTLVKFLIL